ncbi:MAG: hypothetical protein R6V59_06290 [Dehalococcoidia bacterium]
MQRVDNKYISNAIDELVGFLGIKENIPIETVLRPLHNNNTKECIEKIASQLGLPIKVKVVAGESFESRDLVTTNDAGQGTEGITAQVSIPSSLPFYGTPAMQGFPIRVEVSGDCRRYPHTFVATMAHELSHVVLHSLWHKEKNNEIYTDLTAMLLGFAVIMRMGRYAVETTQIGLGWEQTTTTRFGYLTDNQFEFALSQVNRILNTSETALNKMRTRVNQTLSTYKKQLNLYRGMFYEFNKLIEYVDKNPTKKIGKEDVPRIVELHNLNYGERFVSVLRSNEKKLREVELQHSGWFKHPQLHYSRQRLDSLEVFHDDLLGLLSGLTRECDLLKADVTTLRRCVGFLNRFRIKRNVRPIG